MYHTMSYFSPFERKCEGAFFLVLSLLLLLTPPFTPSLTPSLTLTYYKKMNWTEKKCIKTTVISAENKKLHLLKGKIFLQILPVIFPNCFLNHSQEFHIESKRAYLLHPFPPFGIHDKRNWKEFLLYVLLFVHKRRAKVTSVILTLCMTT